MLIPHVAQLLQSYPFRFVYAVIRQPRLLCHGLRSSRLIIWHRCTSIWRWTSADRVTVSLRRMCFCLCDVRLKLLEGVCRWCCHSRRQCNFEAKSMLLHLPLGKQYIYIWICSCPKGCKLIPACIKLVFRVVLDMVVVDDQGCLCLATLAYYNVARESCHIDGFHKCHDKPRFQTSQPQN